MGTPDGGSVTEQAGSGVAMDQGVDFWGAG